MNADEKGAHHCTRENVSYSIAYLRHLAAGDIDHTNIDWPVACAVTALQLEWLLSQLDES
jgi:hypothetical protein